ncbi:MULTISPECIES: polysaccharide pyruvyl transferase family protein [unclassified Glutamicibacter]|uniref:polysaccharide pyruvyl transferase family protein n=1 Tax=unclassified Glutamicibacter TaxID=2627139 RepID=UPI00380DD0AC
MRIGLVGFFGWGNFGDELFFNIWRETLSQYELVRMNDLIEKPYFTKSAVAKASSVDAVIIGGGDLIRIEAISPLYWNGAWTAKPIVVSGIGVAEESKTNRPDVIPRLQKFFSSNNILSLSARDERSAEWISQNIRPKVPVRIVPDLVFADTTPSNGIDGRVNAVPRVAFVLNKKQITESDLEIWGSLLAAHSEGRIVASILVLATGDQREREIDNLKRHGLAEYAESFDDTAQMLDHLRKMDLVMSAKFHALVVASKYGIPYVSLRDTSKSLGLMRYSPSGAIPPELIDLLEPLVDRTSLSSSVQSLTRKHVRDLANAEISHVTGLMNAIRQLNFP